MNNPKDVLVTTTSSIEGVIVKQYLKPISAHIVAGTNFFSDFFASFSDVFGGRSQTYQRQLTSIYNEAIESLKVSAYELGANCIIGLKVDLDEISGKGKSMFMITAIGTAVILEDYHKTQLKVDPQEKLEVINNDKMKELRKRKQIIQKAKSNNLEFDDPVWQFITDNSVFEISSEVLNSAITNYYNTNSGKLYQQLLQYLSSLNENQRTELLYTFLMSNNLDNISFPIYKLIKELMLYDYNYLKKYLNDTDETIKGKALQLVVYEKLFYTKEDIANYDGLIEIITSNFKPLGEISSQKKLLSSKEKEIWICRCGNKNNIEVVFCEKCNKDIYGFYTNQTNPEEAIEKLKENIEFIKNNVA